MKCFWCLRLFEDGKIAHEEIQNAEYVYSGDSMCERDLNAIRRVGAQRLLDGER